MLRRARPSDADAIAEVHVTAWDAPFRHGDPNAGRNDPERRRAFWRDVLGEGRRDVVAATRGERVIGFACAGPMREVADRPQVSGFDAYLYALYVLPQQQRAGVGRSLLQAIAADLVARTCLSLALHVVETNPACAFYERVGARAIRREERLGVTQLAYGWNDISPLARRQILRDAR